jgi:hypothetical protein
MICGGGPCDVLIIIWDAGRDVMRVRTVTKYNRSDSARDPTASNHHMGISIAYFFWDGAVCEQNVSKRTQSSTPI